MHALLLKHFSFSISNLIQGMHRKTLFKITKTRHKSSLLIYLSKFKRLGDVLHVRVVNCVHVTLKHGNRDLLSTNSFPPIMGFCGRQRFDFHPNGSGSHKPTTDEQISTMQGV